jgi:hypothetical protein
MGFIALAYLHAAGGKFDAALSALDMAAGLGNPEVAAHYAYLALLPFRTIEADSLRAVEHLLENWNTDAIAPYDPSGPWYGTHDGIQGWLKSYLLGLTVAIQGDATRAAGLAIELDVDAPSPRIGSVLRDLSYGVRGQVALARDDTAGAKRLLGRTQRQSSYQYMVNSPFFSQSRERFLQGVIYRSTGDYRAAHHAMSFFRGLSIFDWIYVAPSHALRADLCRSEKNAACELEHLQRFVEIWSEADSELQDQIDKARQRIVELQNR